MTANEVSLAKLWGIVPFRLLLSRCLEGVDKSQSAAGRHCFATARNEMRLRDRYLYTHNSVKLLDILRPISLGIVPVNLFELNQLCGAGQRGVRRLLSAIRAPQLQAGEHGRDGGEGRGACAGWAVGCG